MFTVKQIAFAHSKVKSGADFPSYIKEIKELGVQSYEVWVKNGQTKYFGADDFSTKSSSKYDELIIADHCNTEKFKVYLKSHQNGETNYLEFCRHCAETGIEKWFVSLDTMICTYFDQAGQEVLVERIPG
ncbi:DUF1398 domain-containing protein [Pedobacter agri]|uniref:DUF1398 domain-containing protein n=1 Tax=Pedobacter agri TaxID=454586 RepID=UPI002930F800|nr:DUF1398 family protein [Pedobacter agri]